MAKQAGKEAERAFYLDLYRQMVLVRIFEERVHDLFLRGEVYGTTHLCIGQEAVSVGVMGALGDEDRVACTYRGHGTVLALGSPPLGLMAELIVALRVVTGLGEVVSITDETELRSLRVSAGTLGIVTAASVRNLRLALPETGAKVNTCRCRCDDPSPFVEPMIGFGIKREIDSWRHCRVTIVPRIGSNSFSTEKSEGAATVWISRPESWYRSFEESYRRC